MEEVKFFLFLGLDKILFRAQNSKKEFFFKKEILLNSFSIEENFNHLRIFLDNNIIDIEKELNNYINEITMIVDYEEFINVDMSFNYKNKSKNLDLSNSIIDLRNSFIRTNHGYEVVHCLVNKYIINKKSYTILPDDFVNKDLSLEIRFICLKSQIIQKFKDILIKYQISLKKIICSKYIKDFNNNNKGTNQIFVLAEEISNGLNDKEIFISKRSNKNKGIFEKFFNLFN